MNVFSKMISKINGRELLVFLFFLFISSSFWFLKAMNRVVEYDFTVSVSYIDLPSNRIIINEPSSEIHLRLRDKIAVLWSYQLSGIPMLQIPIASHIKQDGEKSILLKPYVEQLVRSLEKSTVLLSYSPDLTKVVTAKQAKKIVPVRFNGDISILRQFIVSGDTILSPNHITVYGSEETLDTLEAVYTQLLELEEVEDTISLQLALLKQPGYKLSFDSVSLFIPVEAMTEKSFDMEVVPIHFPDEWIFRAFPSRVKVIAQVALSSYPKVSVIDFSVGVDFNQVKDNKTGKVVIQIKKYPDYVKNVRVIPSEIEFVLEQRKDQL